MTEEIQNPGNDMVVANDGHRTFSQLSENEQQAVKSFFLANHHLSIRAVARLFQIRYVGLSKFAYRHGWVKERAETLKTCEDLGVGPHHYRSASRELAIGGIYDVVNNLLQVYAESAAFAAREGYLDHFKFDEFRKLIELVTYLEGKFKDPDYREGSGGKDADVTATMMNALQVKLKDDDAHQLSGFAQALITGLVKPTWPEAEQVRGDSEVIDIEALAHVDPAKGETR